MNKYTEGFSLYNRESEHDACGVGLLVNLRGKKSHQLVEKGLQVLENMVHRGAEGADPRTGDGAGIMVQIPHEFILLQGIPVPEKGRYGTGLVFLPHDVDSCAAMLDIIEREATLLSLNLIAVRDVPVNNSCLGAAARAAEPVIKQVFVADEETDLPIEPRLFLLRKAVEKRVGESQLAGREDFYVVSLSSRTMIYKGMLSSPQLRYYYPDLMNPRFTTAMALVHSRFSTNTFPAWKLAQPFRLIGHNGEINTIRGNRLWMQSREGILNPGLFGGRDVTPVIQPGMSDSASLDNVLELLVEAGMSMPHALAMLVPESFNDKNPISPELKAFYEYHSILMEAWDGPATILFSDGRYAGGMLDRNGLRPARYLITNRDTLVIASESGVLPFEASEIREKGHLSPGKMMMVDMEEGRIYRDDELKASLAGAFPYGAWLARNRISLDSITSGRRIGDEVEDLPRMLKAFMYGEDEAERVIIPMVTRKEERGGLTPQDRVPAVFSQHHQPLYNYFRQLFAQVTNPAIDPLREELVMSLDSYIGAVKLNLLDPAPDTCKMVLLRRPIITNRELDLLCNLRYKGFNACKISMISSKQEGADGMRRALERICREAEDAVDSGCNYVVLSDRGVDADNVALPSLLVTSAVHHHLIKRKKRLQTALIVETADAREVMHFALLCGYGASAVNPYLAFGMIADIVKQGKVQLDAETAIRNYIKAIDHGLLRVLSNMGISTLTSYKSARLFEAVGLGADLCRDYFGNTVSRIGGIGMEEICRDITQAHDAAFGTVAVETPPTQDDAGVSRLRDCLTYRRGVALQPDEVESVEEIMKRFVPEADAAAGVREVPSVRRGVTAGYLAGARELMIRAAQGASGDGAPIPPPHHDIYSIEDMAQLIYDLKNINNEAAVGVRLIAECGVGTIAAGVAKAKGDIIAIAGGCGADTAPDSVPHAGVPVEIGLAETQQTLVANNLRGMVRLQVETDLRDGADVIVLAMLGAEEFRVGNEYDPASLRRLAEDVRVKLAEAGAGSLTEIIGRSDLLEIVAGADENHRSSTVDLSSLLCQVAADGENAMRNVTAQRHDLDRVLDREVISRSYPAIEDGMPVALEFPIANTDRSTGAMLSGEIAKRYGDAGMQENAICCRFHGSAGQSFGAFLPKGVKFRLDGDANDYVGKGLSGGVIEIVPARGTAFNPEENIIAGNTILYGASAGEVYINGRVGERFCVCNNGATAVVEGVGDHCCEYMTAGRTVVLGPTGRNFAAGMSGGVAYVWNPEGNFDYFCNMATVELTVVEDDADIRELRTLISNHFKHTRSPLAARMLDDWDLYSKQFLKVTPTGV